MARYQPGDRLHSFTLIRPVPSARGWEMRCDCGDVSVRRTSNITAGKAKTCGDRTRHPAARMLGPDNPLWTDAPSYTAAHLRVKSAKGPARDHSCEDCGGPAAEWSYNGQDGGFLDPKGRPYSGDVTLYVPRCIPCHRTLDARRNRKGVA